MSMSDQIGPVSVPAPEGDRRMAGVSDRLHDVMDQGVRRIIDASARRPGQLLAENRRRLDDVAEQLLHDETLDEADAYAAADIERVPPS